METGFRHGALCDSYEKQANDQGFTLGNAAELFDRIAHSYNMLRIRGYLTDGQAYMVCRKIQKDLIKNLKPLKETIKVMHGQSAAPYCPICKSGEYLHNEDGDRNNYCGQCGNRLDWDMECEDEK